MPFVAVQSKGGPFDDHSYCAGYEMGLLDALLCHAYTFGVVARTIREDNRGQADLIAMRHGWRVRFGETEVSGWAFAEFTRVEPKLDQL